MLVILLLLQTIVPSADSGLYVSPQAALAIGSAVGLATTIVTVLWKRNNLTNDSRIDDLKKSCDARLDDLNRVIADKEKENNRLNLDNLELRGALIKAVSASAKATELAKVATDAVVQKS